jgi:chemotaxis protein MotB
MPPFDDPGPPIRRSVAPGWMITFADLLSLLLAFFVLVFATTTVEQKDWQRVVQPISAYLTGRTVAAPDVSAPGPAGASRLDLSYVSTLVERLVAQTPSLAGSAVSRRDHALLLTLPPGTARPGGAALAGLARLFAGLDNRIEITAHGGTDPSPQAAPVADWRGALQQALAVAAELARLGDAHPIDASGMTDLPGGPQAVRIDIEIDDIAAEAGDAAP